MGDSKKSTEELEAIAQTLRIFLQTKDKRIDRERALERLNNIEEILIDRLQIRKFEF